MKVVIRPQANHDLVEIALHIGAENPADGERFLDAFEYTSNLLVELPTMGSVLSELGI